jgi:hypothetical protein
MKPIHLTLAMAALGASALAAADQPVTLKPSPALATRVAGFPRIAAPSDAQPKWVRHWIYPMLSGQFHCGLP